MQLCSSITHREITYNREIPLLSKRRRYGKASFSKCVMSTKRRAGVFIFLRFEKCFRKASFFDGLVWTVGLTVEIKLRFHVGLMWTAGLTVEIKLRLQIPTAWCR